jgi:DNA polymerase III sliding clamp (beta) subunit (PCNA family)
MKFSCAPEALLSALDTATTAIGRSTKPVCAGIKIEVDDTQSGHLRLTGSDGELFISAPCPAKLDDPDGVETEYVLHPETLNAALLSCKQVVNVEINARGATLTCGKLKAVIPSIDGVYPGTPGERRENTLLLTMNAAELGAAISRASTLAAPKPGRYATNGVNLRLLETLTVQACDGYAHCWFEEPVQIEITGDHAEQRQRWVDGVLLPYAKASVIGNLLSALEGSITLSVLGSRWTMEAPALTVTGLSVEGKFPAVEKAWELGEMEKSPRLLLDRKEWMTALQRLKAFSPVQEGQTTIKVRFQVAGSEASVSAIGTGSCTLPLGFTEQQPCDTQLVVNAANLLKGMACFEGNTLQLRYDKDAGDPLALLNMEEKDGKRVELQCVMSMPHKEK